MSFEIVCRGVLGVSAAIGAAIVKGTIFGGPVGGTAAGLIASAGAVAAKVPCDVISKDTYMRGNCPKLVEAHKEVWGGAPYAMGVLPKQAYENEQMCAPYLPGGSKYWGPAPAPNNQQLTLPQYAYRPDLASQGHDPSQGGG